MRYQAKLAARTEAVDEIKNAAAQRVNVRICLMVVPGKSESEMMWKR
jgi:hypothetical protein